MSYLIHYNKNHSSKDGRFVSGDGDGDGQMNDNANRSKKKGVYSAKIDNYHKGTLFNDPYYVDKKGKKRSYMSYKEMPVEAQRREKALVKGKEFASKAGKMVTTTLTAVGITAALTVGEEFVRRAIKKHNYYNKIDWD